MSQKNWRRYLSLKNKITKEYDLALKSRNSGDEEGYLAHKTKAKELSQEQTLALKKYGYSQKRRMHKSMHDPFTKDDLLNKTKQAASGLEKKLDIYPAAFGVNIHDKKTNKVLSVNPTIDGRETYSPKTGSYYYQKAGKNILGGSWNIVKVDKRRGMFSDLKKFLSWYFK